VGHPLAEGASARGATGRDRARRLPHRQLPRSRRRITAILDWELVHLGDPHEDLGWASLPMYMGGSKLISRLAEPEWFYARYAEKVGFKVSMDSVRYYQALSLLKLAATHMAAARCFEEGRFNDMRMPAMGSQIATCPAPDGKDDRGRNMNNSFREADRRHERHAAQRGADATRRRVRARPGVRRDQPAQHLQGAGRLVGGFPVRADRCAAHGAQWRRARCSRAARSGVAAGAAGGGFRSRRRSAELLALRDDGNRAIGALLGWLECAARTAGARRPPNRSSASCVPRCAPS
jgi:hypothetical protein